MSSHASATKQASKTPPSSASSGSADIQPISFDVFSLSPLQRLQNNQLQLNINSIAVCLVSVLIISCTQKQAVNMTGTGGSDMTRNAIQRTIA